MSRAKVHSPGTCQSGVSSKLKYSTPGSWRKGLWKAYSAPRKASPHPSKHAVLRPIIGGTHPENTIQAGADCYTASVLNSQAGAASDHRSALVAGFLGW